METSFHSQNTGRFYPFDEDAVQDTRSQIPAWTECHLDVLRRGFADLGVVVLTAANESGSIDAVARVENVSDGLFVEIEVRVTGSTYSTGRVPLVPRDTATQLLMGQDFSTVKFGVNCSGSELYGFVTLGCLGNVPPPDHILENVPIHRTCIKPIPCLRSVEAANKDRWLPPVDERCPEVRKPRPTGGDLWRFGDLLEDETKRLHLKAGYNCQIKVNKADNRIVIQPKPGAGLGAVTGAVPLGYYEANLESGVEEFPGMPGSNRYEPRLDTIRELRIAKTFAGAHGANIAVVTDRNFVSFTERRDANDECSPLDLVIRHMGTPLKCDTSPEEPKSRLIDCEP